MRKVFAFTVIGLLAAASSASAQQVQYRFIKSGSAILGYASNPSDRGYNCSGTVAVSYDDYGTRKSTSQQVNYFVRPGLNDGVVYQWQTTWPGSTLSFSYNHRGCT
jgi:hypothetical protein